MVTKITSEEFDQLKIKGWGRSSPIYNAILSLRVGEGIVIPKGEWGRSKTPSDKCRAIEKKYASAKLKYKCVALADDSGWAVKRVA